MPSTCFKERPQGCPSRQPPHPQRVKRPSARFCAARSFLGVKIAARRSHSSSVPTKHTMPSMATAYRFSSSHRISTPALRAFITMRSIRTCAPVGFRSSLVSACAARDPRSTIRSIVLIKSKTSRPLPRYCRRPLAGPRPPTSLWVVIIAARIWGTVLQDERSRSER